jgi:choice-of-anchor B domain-containing protein
MKKFLLIVCSVLSVFTATSQTYPSQNMTLMSHIDPQSTSIGVGSDSRRYSGCWGWAQTSKNKEYAIVGSSTGTWFIDVSNPAAPIICDSVSGRYGCTWREIKTYQNYCYVASDDGAPNTFQIIDMSYLPDSVHVVHKGTTYFERGHTIWIDGNKLYVGSETKPNGGGYRSMTVYSLANPAAPQFLRALASDIPAISVVHDMFVKNDTVYASCANQGLRVIKFNTITNTFSQLGTLTNYPGSGYNHSTYITQNSKYLVMCDEVPSALPIKVLDVQNLSNITVPSTVIPHPATTPHNPYVLGNRWAFVSCYQDGLNLYDISNPNAPTLAGFFDTYPQGGFNVGNYFGADYRGNWGAYPYFPSGLILAVDMQNGIFLIQANGLLGTTVGLNQSTSALKAISVFPNPAKHQVTVQLPQADDYVITVKNILGQTVLEHTGSSFKEVTLNTSEMATGHYILTVASQNEIISSRKLIIQH